MLTYPERVHFTETFCKLLLNMRKTGIRPPTYVILEEGQLYFPQGCMRSMKRHSHAVELVTNGRNFNVRFGVITQFPSMIDKLLVKMCRQRYFGWTNEPNDMRYIEEIIGKKMAEELPMLQVGEFVYSYPVRKGGTTKIKVPMFHSQSRPKLIAHTPRHSRVGRHRRNKTEPNAAAQLLVAASIVVAFFLFLLWATGRY